MRSKILAGPRIWLFIPISFGITALHTLLAHNLKEVGVLFGVNVATLVNIFLIIFIVEKLLFGMDGNKSKGLLAGVFVAKTIVLLLAFMVGIHFVGNRIILSMINYAVQILVLSVFLYNYFYKVGKVGRE